MWLSSLLGKRELADRRRGRRSGRHGQQPAQPRLEQLDDRVLPSVSGLEWINSLPAPAEALTTNVDGGVYVASGFNLSGVFVSKYDADGDQVWTRGFGSGSSAIPYGVAADGSGVYVVGSQTPLDFADAFIRKYDASGNEVWTRQLSSAGPDVAYAIATDGSGVYVCGFTQPTPGGTQDGFVRKYDSNGNELWTRQFGNGIMVIAQGIAADGSGVYVAGFLYGTLPGQSSSGDVDAFVRKYDPTGNEEWTRQLGTNANDFASAIAADGSGVYVVGGTEGALPGQTLGGGGDAFVRRYDASGNESWTRQLGPDASEGATSVAADGSGVYVGGITSGSLSGQTNAGSSDAFVRKYDTGGQQIWTRQFGSAETEFGLDVAAGSSGVYAAVFMGNSSGDPTGFVAKLDVTVLSVQIDVKPGSSADDINLASQGVIPVAILTTPDFDARQVDPGTVELAGAAAVHSALQDVDRDGDLDLVLHFRLQDTDLRELYEQLLVEDMDADGVLDSTRQEAQVTLTGETEDGEHIIGFDEVNLFLSGKKLRELLDELFGS